MEDFKVIGKSVVRLDALEKVTGKARYSADFRVEGMLHASVLRSPHASARILGIDTSKAERLPGVRAVLTPDDVPPVSISPHLGDQYILCLDNFVRCVGDPVAAVAADTVEIAEDAVKLIKVEYEELPAVFDGEEAFAKDQPVVVHPDLPSYKVLTGMPIRLDPERANVCQTYKVRSGDVERGFKEADLVVENKYTTVRMQHCQLEPHVVVAWFEPDGNLTVMSSNQMVYDLKSVLSKVLKLSPSRVRVLSSYIGGGYGGKGGVRAEPIAALLARKAGKPVSLIFTREEMFVFGGHRVPYSIDIKDGVKKDGTLTAREMRVILAIGLYSEKGVLIARRAAAGAVGTYRVPNFKLDSYSVYTNLPMTGALRGFGCPEIQWPIEQQMDIIAEKLGMDPLELRIKNILNEGEKDASGMVTRSIGVRECLDKVSSWIGWGEKPVRPVGPWKTGKGIAIGNKSVIAGSTTVVIVKVWPDGVIELRYSAVELGQGIKTTLAQITAEQFGIPVEQVRMVSGDTDICPFDFGTVASRSLVHYGNAIVIACDDAKQQLYKMAAPKLGAWDLDTREGRIFVKEAPEKSLKITELFTPMGVPLEGGEVLGKGAFTGSSAREDPETGQSERSVFSYSHIANAVEVGVNTETGEIKLLRSGIACDVGKAINPLIVEGQIEGGDSMGVGSALYEEIVFNSSGGVVNSKFTDYRIPMATDMPLISNSKTIIVEVAEPEGPFGAKGVGELSLVSTAPAIANAVYNAVGIRVKDLPITKEKVLTAMRKSGKV
ncbi:MAG: xanthine dehydrogenase family protein molybdopterin-binding subunit [Dehalococcoidia bacterium]|nr:xanthine dehydrogenase family protein molybdopterin-binding subunit [Dehalococcoidia bacterium]